MKIVIDSYPTIKLKIIEQLDYNRILGGELVWS